jgi:hypothetical protein
VATQRCGEEIRTQPPAQTEEPTVSEKLKSLTVEAEGVLLVLAVDGSRDNRPENFARHAKLRRMRKVVLGDVADRGPEREYATLFFEFSLS